MFRVSFALALLLAATLTFAQKLDDPDFSLSVDVQLVQLPVSVEDKHGMPVRDLPKEQFSVYEDKILQEIMLFKQEDIALSVGLVIDASLSMADKQPRVKAAALTFVRESNPNDETALLSFGDDVYIEHEFTNDTSALNVALSTIPPQESTSMYDAVYLAAKLLRTKASRDKKVLLVITDGEDNNSKYTLHDALKAVGESKIAVYTVGLLSPSGLYGSDQQQKAKKELKQLAEVSGGASFFPNSVNEVEGICSRIARDLRNQYTIGYRPLNQKLDGSWRKVVVKVSSPQGKKSDLKVRTKQGYYAPTTKRPPDSDRAVKDTIAVR
jgi:VWFA-related protein